MFAWDNEDIKAQQAAERATASDHAAALPRVRVGQAGCCIARSFSAYWAWSGTGQFHVDSSLVQLGVARMRVEASAARPSPAPSRIPAKQHAARASAGGVTAQLGPESPVSPSREALLRDSANPDST